MTIKELNRMEELKIQLRELGQTMLYQRQTGQTHLVTEKEFKKIEGEYKKLWNKKFNQEYKKVNG